MTATYPDLEGACVFITGGGAGIGAELTASFLRQGARVAFVGRTDASEFVAEMAEAHGNRPLFVQADISDIFELRRAIDCAVQAHGPIAILINNAANDQRHETLEVTEEYWNRNLSINLDAYFFACQAVIPGMKSAGGGAIVNMTSISYMMGNTGYTAYTTSNAGITGMTRSLAREFGPDGIRVNALAPGWVLTEKQLNQWATPEALAAHMDRQCVKRHLVPEDIAGPALFLASAASGMITGQTLAVDGGVVVTG
jgi:galactose dehydrogenase